LPSTILVTGASGFIGKHLIKRLTPEFHTIGISLSTGHDITQYHTLEKNIGSFDQVIHCAASFEADDEDGILKNESINAIGALNVCKLAKAKGCTNFIYISTISSISKNGENDYFNSYALSKRHGEDNVTYFCKANNIRSSVIRLSQVYDTEGVSKRHQPFLFQIIDNVLNGKKIVLHGENNPLRNFIHIDDVVEVIHRVVTQKLSGDFNCVHPTSQTLLDVIAAVYTAANKTKNIEIVKNGSNLKNIYIPNDNILFTSIGYVPHISIQQGVQKIINKKHEKN
jgi:nucleoside-diphosphate-sugar epimerase